MVQTNLNSLITNIVRRYSRLRVVCTVIDENNRFKHCKQRYWSSLIVTSVSNLTILLLLIRVVSVNRLKENPYYLIGFVRELLNVFYSVMTTTFFLIVYVHRCTDAFNECNDLDKSFPMSNEEYLKVRRTFRLQAAFFILVSGVITSIASSLKLLSMTTWSWVFLPPFILVCISPDCKTFHFQATISLLYNRMASIQMRLESLGKIQPKLLGLRNEAILRVWKIEESKTHLRQLFLSEFSEIQKIRELYARCFRLKKLLNDVYGIHLLVLIGQASYEGVFFIFWNITIFQFSGTDAKQISAIQHLLIAGYTAVQVLKLVLVATSCQIWKNRANEMGEIVQDAISRTQDQDTLKELTLFATEIQHRDVNITAAGFCNVDYKLLKEMFGAITMYTIILLQFKFTVDVSKVDPIMDLIYFTDGTDILKFLF